MEKDLPDVCCVGTLKDLQVKLRRLFSETYPHMVYPYKVFEKKGKNVNKIFCYCNKASISCKAVLVYSQNTSGFW